MISLGFITGAELLSRCSNGLRDGRPTFDSWQGQEIFPFTIASRPVMGPIQPPIQWTTGAISSGVKLTIHHRLVPRSRMVELYLHSPIRIYGIVLN
jgi:hypothetical protein